jgi:hypothetical protein
MGPQRERVNRIRFFRISGTRDFMKCFPPYRNLRARRTVLRLVFSLNERALGPLPLSIAAADAAVSRATQRRVDHTRAPE